MDDGAIGAIEHVVAVNDVPYGRVYFNSWYRDYNVTGGLFLQKATHDFDTLNYLLGRRPVQVAAMAARRVYGGDMPHDMRCRNCPKLYTCPESSFTLFYETYNYWRNEPVADDWCVFSREIKDQDCGNVLLEYDNGVQAAYAQNFFVRHKAARRGAKLMGFTGSIEFDFVTGRINVYNHRKPDSSSHDFTFPANLIHTGGNRELAFDFLMAMKERRPSRSPLEAGLLSVLTCLQPASRPRNGSSSAWKCRRAGRAAALLVLALAFLAAEQLGPGDLVDGELDVGTDAVVLDRGSSASSGTIASTSTWPRLAICSGLVYMARSASPASAGAPWLSCLAVAGRSGSG